MKCDIVIDATPSVGAETPATQTVVPRAQAVWFEYLVLALLLSVFLYRGFLGGWRSLNTDFRNYYVAARLYRERSSLLRVYDFTWFQRQKDHAGVGPCLVGFVPDTLLSALPTVPLAGLPPLAAKRVWLLLNLIILAASAVILAQVTRLGVRRILIIMFLAVDPLAKSFLFGQMHLVVFFLVLAAFWLTRRQHGFAAGISVALAAALKLYPAIFLLFFWRKRQWRSLAGTVAGLLGLAAASVALFGWQVHRIYLTQILPAIGRGENIDPYAPGWNSLTALLHRALIREPELNPYPLLHAPNLYALLQPLCQAVIFIPALWLLTPGSVRREHEQLEWAVFAAMLMALSTGPTTYHLCFLILPVALALDSLVTENRLRQATMLVALYGVICLPWTEWATRRADGWRLFLASPRVYPLVALPFFLYGLIGSAPVVRERLRTCRREAWAFGAAFVLLVAAGYLQWSHHVRGQFDSYANRMFFLPGPVLKGEPAVSARGVCFTRMPGVTPSFEVWSWNGREFAALPPAEDEFHPASAPTLADVWVERTGPGSDIVRFPKAPGTARPEFQTEVRDAELPSVSTDGAWLSFIRETHGRGALWIKKLAVDSISADASEREVVATTYDVWEAAFEPGNRRIVFTAALTGQPQLYSLDLTSMRIAAMATAEPARYPAFSPDDHWLAYSRCEHGMWQLHVSSTGSGIDRMLTSADCNSISPSWEAGSKSLVYATDCGRGLEMTALARMQVSR